MDRALKQKNLRTAWLLAVFVLFGFLSTFPDWYKLFLLMTGGAE